jgi:hypothetical protein
MADPLSVIGAVSAVAGLIDSVSRIISSLRDLHDRWKDANFTILNLITQLAALKAALNKIQEWVESDFAEQHHQLAMDLDLSMNCCRMLIEKMDSHVSELRWAVKGNLDIGSRLKVMFGSMASENLNKVIERQISALTLLLTACNW